MNFLNCSLFLLLSLFFVTSCNPDTNPVIEETAALNFNYRTTYGSTPFVPNQWYAFNDSTNIQFSVFDFYISDLTLLRDISPNGDGTEVKEVDLLDFSKLTTSGTADAGLTATSSNIPIGEYNGVRLGIGVTSDLNRTKPSEYAPEHPLRRSDRYSSEWESYVFTTISGMIDTNKDGEGDIEFSYQTGTDPLFTEVALIEGIEILKGDSPTLKFKIDLERLLGGTDSKIDIIGQPNDENLNIATQISKNFVDALMLDN